MAGSCCTVVAAILVRGFAKAAPKTGTTPGSVIPAREPGFANGKIPDTATPSGTNVSAG